MDLHLRGWHEDMVTWWIFFWRARNLRQSLQEVAICWPLVEKGIVCERICWPLTLQGFQEWLQSHTFEVFQASRGTKRRRHHRKVLWREGSKTLLRVVYLLFPSRFLSVYDSSPCLWSLLKSSHHEPITSPRPARGIDAAANRWKSSSPWPVGCGGWRFSGTGFHSIKRGTSKPWSHTEVAQFDECCSTGRKPLQNHSRLKMKHRKHESTSIKHHQTSYRRRPSAWGCSSSSLVTNCASQVCAGFNWVLFPVGPYFYTSFAIDTLDISWHVNGLQSG